MCTYATERAEVTGSGKGPARWTRLSTATVYYDHPVHASDDHTLNIDLGAVDGDPGSRVALELSATAAVELAATIIRSLGSVPPDVMVLDDESAAFLEALQSAISVSASASASASVSVSQP